MVPLDELEERYARPRLARIALALVPALAFLALLWWGLSRTASDAEVGGAAPSFELPTVVGDDVLSSEDLRGRPVVVNFWASWCIPCRQEAEVLEAAWREYEDDGVVFVGINIKDQRSDARRFLEEFDITYPNVRDLDQRLVRAFGVIGLPETFFIDHNYTFVATVAGPRLEQQGDTVILGAIDEDELVSNIEVLIRRAAGGSPP